MSLTAAIRTAQGSLHTTGAQTAITSRNVGSAGEAGYSRKIALVAVNPNTGGHALSVARSTDKALFTGMVDATSRAAAGQALADGLDAIARTLGDPELDRSPAALVGALADAIQLYSAAPGEAALAHSAVMRAKELAAGLNDASAAVNEVRRQADADMAVGADRLNGLLKEFEAANRAVVIGTHAGADITDKLDARDRLLTQISELIGVGMVMRAGNDAVLYTDSGVTLFETTARTVSFAATPGLAAGLSGNALFVDGVAVTGSAAPMPIRSGQLQGLARLRDEVSVTYHNQLDEIARGLIEAFAEADQSDPPTLPDRPGLFTYAGAPAMPAGALAPGLAGAIRVSASVDPSQGGSASRLRDGGISDLGSAAYVYNGSGAAGFSGRLEQYLTNIGEPRSFDPAAGIETASAIGRFAASSVGWLQGTRQAAVESAGFETALRQRASDAFSNATGVNIDDEMMLLLQLEKSYQASSKLLATIDNMLALFMAEIR